jgi:hypothetical protein
MQINKMTPETLEWIATCANEAEHASVRKLCCSDVRGLLAERAALVAVAEAAKKRAEFEKTFPTPTAGDVYQAAQRSGFKAEVEIALQNLAAIRKTA